MKTRCLFPNSRKKLPWACCLLPAISLGSMAGSSGWGGTDWAGLWVTELVLWSPGCLYEDITLPAVSVLWAAWAQSAVPWSPGNCWSTQSTKWLSGNCCYQLLPGKVWLPQLESFQTQGLPWLPEGPNGGLEQSLFILIRHKVFIVGGCIILMLSVMKYKNLFLSPLKKKKS